MNPMKRGGVAVVLVVGVMLIASTPARAGQLVSGLANTGAEPQAKGYAVIGRVYWDPVYHSKVTIKCQHLTPGATYWTPVGTFKAGGSGGGSASGWWYGDPLWVVRLNPDGSWAALVLVSEYY